MSVGIRKLFRRKGMTMRRLGEARAGGPSGGAGGGEPPTDSDEAPPSASRSLEERASQIEPEDWDAVGRDFSAVGDDLRRAIRHVDQGAPEGGAIVDSEASRYPRWSEGAPGDPPRPVSVLEALELAGLDPGPLDKLGLWGAWRYARRIGRQVKEEIMAQKLVTQPTAAPTRKVRASAFGGVLVAILIAGAAQIGYPLPEEAATEVASALIVLGGTIAGYWTRERST